MRFAHDAGREIVQGKDAGDGRGEGGGNLGVADVGDVTPTGDIEVMDAGVEGEGHLAGRAGEIDG